MMYIIALNSIGYSSGSALVILQMLILIWIFWSTDFGNCIVLPREYIDIGFEIGKKGSARPLTSVGALVRILNMLGDLEASVKRERTNYMRILGI
jgi:hypothetical protein